MNTRIRSGGLLVALLLGLAATGCATSGNRASDWRTQLTGELPVLGHRNWIVIADSAYPAQTSPGIETRYTGAGQVETVRDVLATLDGLSHVRPVVHLDAELAAVPETLAPGITAYRESLDTLLAGRRVERLPHADLIARLDAAGATFRILILKTELTLPYTSVFLELDCGYWGPEAEARLREAIGRATP